ncbi:hypothetical protein ACMFMG_001114 [Clarireedia jacksonii]
MRFTAGESAGLLLFALPTLISALPLNSNAPIEQLVPVHPSKRSDAGSVNTLSEVLRPVAHVPISKPHIDAIRKLKERWDQLINLRSSPGGAEFYPSSTSHDIIEERDTTATATAVLIETISNGVGIPGFPAPATLTSTSAVTNVHTSFVTHSASVVTVVHTESSEVSVDTTCTESSTLAGLPTGPAGSTPTDATSTVHSTSRSGLPTGIQSTFHPSGTASASFSTRRSSQAFRPSGSRTRSGVRSSQTVRPSGSRTRSGAPSSRTIHPSGTSVHPSGSVTTIIGSTSTQRVYTTVDAATSVASVSGVKQSASASAVISSLHLSSSGVKAIASPTSAQLGGPTNHSTTTAHASSTSIPAHSSSTSSLTKPSSSSQSSSAVKPSSTATSTAKATATGGGGSPVETTKIIYKGVQKVEPFIK